MRSTATVIDCSGSVAGDDAIGPLLLGRVGRGEEGEVRPLDVRPVRSVDPGQHQGVGGPAEGSYGGSVGVEVGGEGAFLVAPGGQEVGCGEDLGAGEPERVAGRGGDGAVDAVADVTAPAQVLVHLHRSPRASDWPLRDAPGVDGDDTVVVDGRPLDGVVGPRRPEVAGADRHPAHRVVDRPGQPLRAGCPRDLLGRHRGAAAAVRAAQRGLSGAQVEEPEPTHRLVLDRLVVEGPRERPPVRAERDQLPVPVLEVGGVVADRRWRR